MKKAMTVDDVQQLREELRENRERSLAATRQNDFRAVARLTAEAAPLNRTIRAQEDFAECSPKVLAMVDALSAIEDEGHFVFPDDSEPSGGWSEAA
jgi:hypothetical protein